MIETFFEILFNGVEKFDLVFEALTPMKIVEDYFLVFLPWVVMVCVVA